MATKRYAVRAKNRHTGTTVWLYRANRSRMWGPLVGAAVTFANPQDAVGTAQYRLVYDGANVDPSTIEAVEVERDRGVATDNGWRVAR